MPSMGGGGRAGGDDTSGGASGPGPGRSSSGRDTGMGRGTGSQGGMFDLGVRGPQSHVDAHGNFNGIVDTVDRRGVVTGTVDISKLNEKQLAALSEEQGWSYGTLNSWRGEAASNTFGGKYDEITSMIPKPARAIIDRLMPGLRPIATAVIAGGWQAVNNMPMANSLSEYDKNSINNIVDRVSAKPGAVESIKNTVKENTPEGGQNGGGDTVAPTPVAPEPTAPTEPEPPGSQIPGNILPGVNQYVQDTGKASSDYQTKAGKLEADWKDFEEQYFGEYQGIKDDYKKKMSDIPGLDYQLPTSMGGASISMAPTAHQRMYQNEANALAGITGQQASTGMAGIQGRTGLAQNMYGVDFAQAGANRLPADLAMDLYKMERAGELGLQQVEAGRPDKKSGWETWAPVVGGLLTPGAGGKSAADELKSLFTEGWG